MKKLYLVFPDRLGTIAPEIYGHFTEHIGGVIYDGIWVGKDSPVPNIRGFRRDLVEKLRTIHPPVMRWPGGCFAETYDWRDGIGPERPTRINWWNRNDHRYEPNEVGTHEFMDFCALTGAAPYFAANITSSTPLEIRNWADYCCSPEGTTSLAALRAQNGHPAPFDVPYWGIGNENWGGGGNTTPDAYAREYRKYAALVDNAFPRLKLIACGPNADDYEWTRGVAATLADSERHIAGLSLHYYCGFAGDPVAFTENEWYQQLGQAARMDEILRRHWSILQSYGLDGCAPLVIDEWGCWHPDGSGPSKGQNLFEQQSTMRDALVAALTLNIFNNNCDKILMANVAQLVNNLHSLFLSAGERCITTPTFHVFDLYQGHQGAAAVRAVFDADALPYTDKEGRTQSVAGLSVSASVKDGFATVTIANPDLAHDAELSLEAVGGELCGSGVLRTLAHADPHAHNTFEAPDTVRPCEAPFDTASVLRVPEAGVVSLRAAVR